MKQQTLMGLERYGKTTRRGRFLADMDRIVPWAELEALIEPFYLHRLEVTAAVVNLFMVKRGLLAMMLGRCPQEGTVK